jgi:D-alanine-D-alanine ligase
VKFHNLLEETFMKIGLAYDLKDKVPPAYNHSDDALEEYDSMETITSIKDVLEAKGHSVLCLGGGRDFATGILNEKVDIVFNIAEGLGNFRSREAQVPSILEMLNIPYSGSDPQCLAICLDKPLTKKILAVSGIATPRWFVINNIEQLHSGSWDDFPFPAFVKLAYEGSSKGITSHNVVDSPHELEKLVIDLLKRYKQPLMVEKYIAGDEVTVGVIGNSPPGVVGIMRILPKMTKKHFIYSLGVKRNWEQMVDYECPAQLKGSILQRIADSSLQIFKVLGCRDFARIDFKISHDGIPYFLEINPLPGLNAVSGDLPIMANRMGWAYEDLILKILASAVERYPLCICK